MSPAVGDSGSLLQTRVGTRVVFPETDVLTYYHRMVVIYKWLPTYRGNTVDRTTQFTTAVETFQNSTEMSEAEAEVFVARQLAGWGRSYTAKELDKSKNTVDNQVRSAKDKAKMPGISKVEPHKRVSGDRVIDIWFDNDARLRYRSTNSHPERETILEETFRADDPETVHTSTDLALEIDELHKVSLESISMYINDYKDNLDAFDSEWHNLFEALTCYEP